MSFRGNVVIAIMAFSLTSISARAIEPSESLVGVNPIATDARQVSVITNPFRRVANSTRNVVKYIRDYSMARYKNTTTPAPQTSVGRRVVPLLQHVTLDNIRDAVNVLLSSPAAPAVVGFIKNIDRDTLQLFNSYDRTLPPLGFLPTTTTSTSAAYNSTITGETTEKEKRSNGTATTVVSVLESSTTAGVKADIRSNINVDSGSDRLDKVKRVIAVENENDEDDSTEDD